MKYVLKFFLILFVISCEGSSSDCCVFPDLREEIIINKGIFTVSYNEVYEQPNWIEYSVSNRPKNVDRGNKNCAHKKNRKSGQWKPFIFFDQKV